MEIELTDEIKVKLSEAVTLWADENLVEQPAILANMLYLALEVAMVREIKKIHETFGS